MKGFIEFFLVFVFILFAPIAQAQDKKTENNTFINFRYLHQNEDTYSYYLTDTSTDPIYEYRVISDCAKNTYLVEYAKYHVEERPYERFIKSNYPLSNKQFQDAHNYICKIAPIQKEYIKNVVSSAQENWKPKHSIKSKYPIYTEAEITIDKKGNIVKYDLLSDEKYKELNETKFVDKKFKMSVENFLNTLKFPALPDNYKVDTYKIKIRFVYEKPYMGFENSRMSDGGWFKLGENVPYIYIGYQKTRKVANGAKEAGCIIGGIALSPIVIPLAFAQVGILFVGIYQIRKSDARKQGARS